jgi:chemotaxis protein CheY-P-specific phosphatase CheC
MASWNPELSEEQTDSLKEVGNIGAGHAASELAELIGKKCVVSIPELICIDAAGIREFVQNPEAMVVALHMNMLGDIPAEMLVLTRRPHAQRMLDYMSPTSAPKAERNLEAFQLALRQLGEVLTKSFADAISQFLGTSARYTFADAAGPGDPDAVTALLESSSDGAIGSYLAIQASFFDFDKTFEGKLIYLLSAKAQKMILEKIDQLLG